MKYASFSVLMSVYSKENPLYLDEALKSIYEGQTLKPKQIVLIKDGPLNEELEEIIKKWKVNISENLTIVTLDKNIGLARALNEGLKHCAYEIVARMDSDDISLPERFSLQYQHMVENENISVSSGQIEEWDESLKSKISERNIPLTHKEIVNFLKFRSPINHPAAIFRKSHVIQSGGYPEIYPEDYALWGRMIKKGYSFSNLPNKILIMRAGNAITTRRGLNFLKGELKVLLEFKREGLISTPIFLISSTIKIFVRMNFKFIKLLIYKKFR